MKNRHFVIIIVTVILLGFLLLWYAGRPKPDRIVKVKPTARTEAGSGELSQRDATLYFSSDDGLYLVSETRQLGCSGEEGCVQAVVEALISGPVHNGIAVLPEKAKVLNVAIEHSTATLNFSSDVSSGHPGGSQTELLTIYSLANSIAVNFPHIRQVSILVNGLAVDTLRGHVDLRRPMTADFTFARQPGAGFSAAPAETGSVKE